MQQTIELDCAPEYPRPGDLFPAVIKDTGLNEKEPCGKFFGNWVWDYSEVSADIWQAVRPLIKDRITKLYNEGYIRYGSW